MAYFTVAMRAFLKYSYMKITLIHPHSQKEVLAILYTAYRICYSKKSVSEIIADIKSGLISEIQIQDFLTERFKTGHTAPLRQIHFIFTAEDISRVLTAQFNRHTIGIDRCEMSQRYVKLDNKNELPVVVPKKLEEYDSTDHEEHPADCLNRFYVDSFEAYDSLQCKNIAIEDARYILPMGTTSREQFSMSFQALQHFLGVRMCSCSQDEIQEMAWKMYKIMRKQFPFLSKQLGVKCWKNRLGYCDESEKQYHICKWNRTRPHKKNLMKMWEGLRKRSMDEDRQMYM